MYAIQVESIFSLLWYPRNCKKEETKGKKTFKRKKMNLPGNGTTRALGSEKEIKATTK